MNGKSIDRPNKQKNRNAEITVCWSEGEMSHGILYKFSCRNGQHDVPGHEPYGASIPFKQRMRIEN